ncbi:ribonuclease J [candidate division WWE3 bacterium]|uniref:Ribonuclease J n=1 Tax=candidate division WWE3 bacterium TaxID=2053526 RepID=A0A7X9HS82_UNCKA|nr:ribonuclease J [candidate division WWE3 bacterium]
MQFLNISKNKNTTSKPVLKIITIGGTDKVNKNLTIYEYKDEIIVVDCGIGFPDIFDMPGVDVLIPDFTYLIENSYKIKGLFITHGHEDHVGAVPNLLLELPDIPIYASKLVGEFLKVKLEDNSFKEMGKRFSYHLMTPESGVVNLGNFKVSAFRINHSIPESMGYAIRTPEGIVLHIADYKFDDTPVLDKPADVETMQRLSKEGVLCLLSDCLGVTSEGHTKSESTLTDTFIELFGRAGKRQILVTTMSSNISRMFQIMNATQRYGRKIVVSGRSIEQMVDVARRLSYLPFPDDFFVKEQVSGKYPQEELVYLIAGCYGQPESSLGRLSRGEHESITLEDNAMVIFSGDPNPPGADITVEKVMDALTLRNAEVIYGEIQDDLHVSGHAVKGDIERMTKLINAKYYIPIGGTITKMRAYTNLLGKLGIAKDRVFEMLEGDSVEFSYGSAKKGSHIQVKPVYMGSNKIEELNPIVVKDRNQLCNDGVFVVAVPVTKKGNVLTDKIEIITRGFIYVKDSKELMGKSKKFIGKRINKLNSKKGDITEIKKKLENDIGDFLRRETSMTPMVIVHFITI